MTNRDARAVLDQRNRRLQLDQFGQRMKRKDVEGTFLEESTGCGVFVPRFECVRYLRKAEVQVAQGCGTSFELTNIGKGIRSINPNLPCPYCCSTIDQLVVPRLRACSPKK